MMIATRRRATSLVMLIVALAGRSALASSPAAARPAAGLESLAKAFASPPKQYRLYVWWHWMGLTISRYGIKRDLTAMKAAGVRGATICPVGSQAGAAGDIANSGVAPVRYWSPKFWSMVRYADSTAKRLGLKLGMENCPGWSASGGPWITPALSMKKLTWSTALVKGGKRVVVRLKQPPTTLNVYHGVCVLALPQEPVVQPKQIRNLSADLSKNGKLTWQAPPGTWRIYRMGYTSAGTTDHPVPDGVHSLEADKLSAAAARFHIDHVIGAVRKHLGAAVGTTFTHLLFDSYEAGPQNWTANFRKDFIALRHYDPLPWLPVLTGAVIGSPDQSQRFRFDMARTVSQLFVQKDFNVYHKLIDAAGMKMCLEPYTGPFNTVAAAGSCDITMGEFWNNSRDGIASNVAGAARALGRRIVGAETLTGGPGSSRMTETPAFLKKALDGGFLSGVNLCFLHDWTLQALNKKYRPGILMGWWGTHFGENQPWFKPGIAFFTYINRCQTMLQQGSQVCDVCALNTSPSGFSQDAISFALFKQATVKRGRIMLPTGRSYRLMTLPNSTRMLPWVAKKLESLVAAGATIIGPRPTRSPSLTDYPTCDRQVAAIGHAVWGDCNGKTVREHRYGKGLVAWNKSVRGVLAQLGVQPDFKAGTGRRRPIKIISAIYGAGRFGHKNVTGMLRAMVRHNGGDVLHVQASNSVLGPDPAVNHVKTLLLKYAVGGKVHTMRIPENRMCSIPAGDVEAIHRHAPGLDIYFVANRSNHPADVRASFRVAGKAPELWWPDTGRIIKDGRFFASTRGRTNVPLQLGPWGSVFVVFRRATAGLNPVRSVRGPADASQIRLSHGGMMKLIAAKSGVYHLTFASGAKELVSVKSLPAARTIPGPWKVAFTPGWGAPAHVLLHTLISWSTSPTKGIRYFSGTGTYTRTITVSPGFVASARRVILHLGTVKNIAQVWVNGHNMGVAWHAPFQLNITKAIKPGKNRLRIAVSNTWVNRLIGDDRLAPDEQWTGTNNGVGRPLLRFPQWVKKDQPPPAGHYTFATWNYYRKTSRLRKAGLLGPVRLTVQAVVKLRPPLAK